MEPKKLVKLSDINPHIVCLLCAGYLVHATTIVECLHTFCKSCIVRYLQTRKTCPTCGIVVSETDPLSALTADRTMQDIMYKLLPDVMSGEEKKEREFYAKEERRKKQSARNLTEKKPLYDFSKFCWSYRNDEQINVQFEIDKDETTIDGIEVTELHNKYVRCSCRVTIESLRKLFDTIYHLPADYYQLIFKCQGTDLNNDEHLRQIYLTHWGRKGQPLVLHYAFRKLCIADTHAVSIVINEMLDRIIHCVDNQIPPELSETESLLLQDVSEAVRQNKSSAIIHENQVSVQHKTHDLIPGSSKTNHVNNESGDIFSGRSNENKLEEVANSGQLLDMVPDVINKSVESLILIQERSNRPFGKESGNKSYSSTEMPLYDTEEEQDNDPLLRGVRLTSIDSSVACNTNVSIENTSEFVNYPACKNSDAPTYMACVTESLRTSKDSDGEQNLLKQSEEMATFSNNKFRNKKTFEESESSTSELGSAERKALNAAEEEVITNRFTFFPKLDASKILNIMRKVQSMTSSKTSSDGDDDRKVL